MYVRSRSLTLRADFIWYQDNGPWSTRFTAWYLPGLLYRAEGDDVKNAIASIEGM